MFPNTRWVESFEVSFCVGQNREGLCQQFQGAPPTPIVLLPKAWPPRNVWAPEVVAQKQFRRALNAVPAAGCSCGTGRGDVGVSCSGSTDSEREWVCGPGTHTVA